MYNKIIMVGNLTRDVELRYLPSGSALATLGLASNRRFKKPDGSPGEEVCFVDVKLFGRSAEVANQYLRKGSKILIEGRLSFETWNDQSGMKKSKHTIIAESMQMLDSKPSSENTYNNHQSSYDEGTPNYSQSPNYGNQYGNQKGESYSQNIPEINIDEDEIPF
ncbi:single-stranded DNA-binding protein [Helicobacter marmotae]|uniref:Single-stranded DNA-binding protein n=1 Tax=Helicobacter marmotae TaxID=152490 RepID=A0A3D8I3Y0_9HELI|nr:single-stranded DNA-binding protein [Helicobacter marmotae]RDU59837.1 single-stranded DNA-binding protein [Helicobacter marmotae]